MRSPGGEADKGLGGWNRPLLSRQGSWINRHELASEERICSVDKGPRPVSGGARERLVVLCSLL
jgi:hypothetical protein